jgi:enolase-phosphatase E1
MPRYIVTDIEGTTTDIDFVQKILFPYAAQHLPNFIRQNADQPSVRICLDETLNTMLVEKRVRAPHHSVEDTAIAQLLDWIEEDRKHPALKTLQGMIWKKGYEEGAYKAHVYGDVEPALKRWRAEGLNLAVYSSGSVAAQKLLFRYSVAGDLTPYFSDYFDTHIGAKRDADSYAGIAETLDIRPIDALFLSDMPEELEAAAYAGLQVLQLKRDERTSPSRFSAVSSFEAIVFESTNAFC